MKKIIFICFITSILTNSNVFGMLIRSVKKYQLNHAFPRLYNKRMTDQEYVSWIQEMGEAQGYTCQSVDKKITQDQQLIKENKAFADFLYKDPFAQECLKNYLQRTTERNQRLIEKMKSQKSISNQIEAIQRLDPDTAYYKKDILADLVYKFNDLEKEIKKRE